MMTALLCTAPATALYWKRFAENFGKRRREFSSPVRRPRRTHPAMFPLFALDRIYWDVELQGEEFHVHRSRLARVSSDHLPVVARLRVHRRPLRVTPYVTGDALPPAE